MKDALGHGSNGLGSRIQGVLARGHTQAERAVAQEWMGNGTGRKPGSEIMYDRAMTAAKARDDADAALALHSGTSKSNPVSIHPPGVAEMADLRARLRAKGFETIRKD